MSKPLDAVGEFVDVFGGVTKRSNPVIDSYYKAAVADLRQVTTSLLTSTVNIATWLHRFRDFDFRQENASHEFNKLKSEFRAKRIGPGFKDMKWACGDIASIYEDRLKDKLEPLFGHDERAAKAECIFEQLGTADSDMLAYIDDVILLGIEKFISDVEVALSNDGLSAAQRQRLKFETDTSELSDRLEQFSDELSNLVLQFGRIARAPITLSQPRTP